MPRNRTFSEPEYSAEYSADCSVTLPSDPGQAVGRTHEVTVRSSGCCLCLPRFMRLTFVPDSLENLYQTYFRRQRHETLLVLVVFAALFDCYIIVMCAVLYTGDKLASVAVASVGLAADVLLYLLCRFGLLPDRVTRRLVPYALWVLIAAQIFCYLGLNFARFHQPSDTLLANIVIYFCAITVGVMSYYMADRKHRKAFLEARQSLEVKLNMEEQSQQQPRPP
ncbi:hypothetical protein cypCar_00027567 [Cyprinus carpio]|nr:hypothetical protein cypCar_00027567 [Cyprinus carpio]